MFLVSWNEIGGCLHSSHYLKNKLRKFKKLCPQIRFLATKIYLNYGILDYWIKLDFFNKPHCHQALQITYSGLSNKHTMCVYLFPSPFLPCAAFFHSSELNSTDSPLHLFIFGKIPCPVRLLDSSESWHDLPFAYNFGTKFPISDHCASVRTDAWAPSARKAHCLHSVDLSVVELSGLSAARQIKENSWKRDGDSRVSVLSVPSGYLFAE